MSNTNADDTIACFLEVQELRSSIARISQKIAVTYGRYGNMGVDTDSVKAAMMLSGKKDPHAWLKALTVTAALVDIIPTETGDDGQVSFMPGLVVPPVSNKLKHQVAIAAAYNEGFHAGLHGADESNNKYSAGSAERAQWSTGHIDGQAQKALKDAHKRQKPGVADAPTEKRGRGRPKKAAVETTTILERDEAAYRAGVQAEAAKEIAATEQERAA